MLNGVEICHCFNDYICLFLNKLKSFFLWHFVFPSFLAKHTFHKSSNRYVQMRKGEHYLACVLIYTYEVCWIGIPSYGNGGGFFIKLMFIQLPWTSFILV